jgi:acyl-CoA synthetase (AMP-forming)/AMP-acid ligase II
VLVPDILDLVAAHAGRRPDAVAIRHLRTGRPPEEITWAGLLHRATQARSALLRDAPADRFVRAYVGKSIAKVLMLIGTIASGRTYAGISPKFRLPQLLHVLDACGTGTVIVDSSSLLVLRDGLSRETERLSRSAWWWLDPPATSAMTRAAAEAVRRALQMLEVPELLGSQSTLQDPLLSSLDPDREAICLFTSGSTGNPKGVLVSWSDLYRRAQAECDLFGLSDRDRLLNLLPFSFDVGLNQLMSCLVSGAELTIQDSWMPVDILNAIATHSITGVSGVPSIWLDLLKTGKVIQRAGPHASLRYLTVSGGDMQPDQFRRLIAATGGVEIFKTYGQTESFRSSALRPEELEQRPSSVGRPFGSARVYIVRPDGTRADVGETGEVIHTGLGVMLGYLNPAGNERKRQSNPFFGPDDPSPYAIFTGDQGRLDDQGYLFLAGRQDDMVKVSGNRIHLSELAAEITAIPGVFAAEAVSVPVTGGDPLLAVFVIPSDVAAGLTPQQLGIEAARRVPSYMVPKLFQIRSEYPLTPSGKPDRQSLREEAARLLQSGGKPNER